MKRILIVTGSRADFGLLEWPIKKLQEEPEFAGQVLNIWGAKFDLAFAKTAECLERERPDLMLILGDRYEILAAATAAHLQRVPIAHIGGGDVTEGSYDDAMRDCISRMASVHFVTSTSAMARLSHMGLRNVHLVGNPGIDYIRHADWRGIVPYKQPYVVVSYQPETLEGTNEIEQIIESLPEGKFPLFILPNPDLGSAEIAARIRRYQIEAHMACGLCEFMPHQEFLNTLLHCDEFIGNSSAMLYEAPELGIKTRMIGKRQRGRTIPWGDGEASNRIVNILKHCVL